MSQIIELTLNYDNERNNADKNTIINYDLEKIFATEMNISMEKV